MKNQGGQKTEGEKSFREVAKKRICSGGGSQKKSISQSERFREGAPGRIAGKNIWKNFRSKEKSTNFLGDKSLVPETGKLTHRARSNSLQGEGQGEAINGFSERDELKTGQ